MKRLLCLLFALLLLTGCGARKVDLLPNASPDTSALALYQYDGEIITRQFCFFPHDAIKDFQSARAEAAEVDVTTLRPPYYGLEMGSTEGRRIYGLWADGHYITGTGETYKWDYDFERFLRDHDWEESDELYTLSVMPCADQVAKTDAGWNVNFLTPAPEPEPVPDDLAVELAEQTNETMTIRYTNRGTEEWMFGHAFTLQVSIDDLWYRIPAEQEMAFTEEGLIVMPGGDREETYRISAYGALPAGYTYRLLSDSGMVLCEFAMVD